jgi:hypothetical protein
VPELCALRVVGAARQAMRIYRGRRPGTSTEGKTRERGALHE